MEGDNYDYLNLLGKTESEKIFWQHVKQALVNGDGIRQQAGMLMRQLRQLREDPRLWRTGTTMRGPLTQTSVALQSAVESINEYLADAAKAMAEKESAPVAKKSTSKPTQREYEKMEDLARLRRQAKDTCESLPQLLIPSVFNEYYEERLRDGTKWNELEDESIIFTHKEETSLEASTRKMLDRAAEQTRPSRIDYGSTRGRRETSAKRPAESATRTSNVAQRIRESSRDPVGVASSTLPERQPEEVKRKSVTTRQLRQRTQLRQQELLLTQQLNEIADENFRARRNAKSTVTREISAEAEKSELKPEVKPAGERSETEVSQPTSDRSSEASSEVKPLLTPLNAPSNWVVFKYDPADVAKKMVRLNVRLNMELEDRTRLIMIDPWSTRSVSGISQLAQQVEAEAPTVFPLDKPVRVVSTRLEGAAHFHVFRSEVRVVFKTPSKKPLVVYLGYVPHLRGMIVFGADFLQYFKPTFVIDPFNNVGYMFLQGDRIPVETVRTCLPRPDVQRPVQEEERRKWAAGNN